ncbi:unnamed protein product, partial [Amoebophrya sp. A25]
WIATDKDFLAFHLVQGTLSKLLVECFLAYGGGGDEDAPAETTDSDGNHEDESRDSAIDGVAATPFEILAPSAFLQLLEPDANVKKRGDLWEPVQLKPKARGSSQQRNNTQRQLEFLYQDD